MPEYLTPEEVDAALKLRRGQSARLARRGLIPALILPDRTVRFPPNIIALLQNSDGLVAARAAKAV